ncbi:hypothetical protein V1517DRAFT_314794 [Lipomyces orientalis]|uniref:Uncharacterized protein n=1 Tax=Lipomyces orientalis TaxID=1233043 RepID=A0ACC3TW49_9ASCO
MGMHVRTSRAQGAVQKLRMYARLQSQSSWSVRQHPVADQGTGKHVPLMNCKDGRHGMAGMHGSRRAIKRKLEPPFKLASRSSSTLPYAKSNSGAGRDIKATAVNVVDTMQSFVSSDKPVIEQNEGHGVQSEAKAKELKKLLSLKKLQDAKREENMAIVQETRRKRLSDQLQMAAQQGQKKDPGFERGQGDGALQKQAEAKRSPLAELFHGLQKAAEARERQRQRAVDLKARRLQMEAQSQVQPSLESADITKIVESVPVSKASKWKQDKNAAVVALRQEQALKKERVAAEARSRNQQKKASAQHRVISNIPNTELPKSGYVDLVDEQRAYHSRLSLQEVQQRLPLGHKLIRVQLEDSRGKGSLMVVRVIKKKNSELSAAERVQLVAKGKV